MTETIAVERLVHVSNCLGFVRRVRYVFYRGVAGRGFLDSYQSLLLDQPDTTMGKRYVRDPDP